MMAQIKQQIPIKNVPFDLIAIVREILHRLMFIYL